MAAYGCNFEFERLPWVLCLLSHDESEKGRTSKAEVKATAVALWRVRAVCPAQCPPVLSQSSGSLCSEEQKWSHLPKYLLPESDLAIKWWSHVCCFHFSVGISYNFSPLFKNIRKIEYWGNIRSWWNILLEQTDKLQTINLWEAGYIGNGSWKDWF